MNELVLERFNTPITALRFALEKSAKQKDAGRSFYDNKGRDILFRLESLCRMYKGFLDKKFFDKWYKEFKELEDALGNMDYNESLYNEFSTYKELKKQAEKIYKARLEQEAEYVSEILANKGWLNGQKLKEFSSGLQNIPWLEPEPDAAAFGNGMIQELNKLVVKYGDGELDPYKLEEGLHEFRRKLRWVSIYASASDGLIQLRQVSFVPKDLVKYCPSEIVKSPFNQMPKSKKDQKTILIQSTYFYAMSWMVRQLSELKDTAFRYEAYQNLVTASGVDDKKIHTKFLDSCKFDPADVSSIAESLMDDFIHRDFIPERISRDILRSLI